MGLTIDPARYESTQAHQMLAQWIYQDHSVMEMARPAWLGALAVFVVGLAVAIPRDRARRHLIEHGRRLKGPQMVTVGEFNRWSRADGIGFATTKRTGNPHMPRTWKATI